MNYLNFEIVRIYAGWFDVKFTTEEKQVEISSSDAWGNDSPRNFLKMLCNLADNKTSNRYVVFDEEPGTYVVHIEKGAVCKFSILYSEYDYDKWPEVKMCGERKLEEVETMIPGMEELFIVTDFSLEAFARTVVRGFEEYFSVETRAEYEGNWMEFPEKEFLELRDRFNF